MNKLRNLLVLILLLAGPLAQAHIASNGFLTLAVHGSRVSGSIELAIRDGELAVGLDHDGNGKVTWGELKSSETALQNFVRGHLRLAGEGGPCPFGFGHLEVNDRVDGSYLWLPIRGECAAAIKRLLIEYTLLDSEDPSHRGLLALTANGAVQTAVLGGNAAVRQFELNDPTTWSAFIEFLRAGVRHIWSGIDHLLFLLSLLLPAVLLRRQNRWDAVPIAAPALSISSRSSRPLPLPIQSRCHWPPSM